MAMSSSHSEDDYLQFSVQSVKIILRLFHLHASLPDGAKVVFKDSFNL